MVRFSWFYSAGIQKKLMIVFCNLGHWKEWSFGFGLIFDIISASFYCREIQGFQEAGAFKERGVVWEILALLDQMDQLGKKASLALQDMWRTQICW